MKMMMVSKTFTDGECNRVKFIRETQPVCSSLVSMREVGATNLVDTSSFLIPRNPFTFYMLTKYTKYTKYQLHPPK